MNYFKNSGLQRKHLQPSSKELQLKRIANTQAEAAAVVAGETTKATAKVEGAAVSIAADTAESAVNKETATENIAANTAEGASEAGASAAGLPFPWNLVAIGGAIAAAIAAFACDSQVRNRWCYRWY